MPTADAAPRLPKLRVDMGVAADARGGGGARRGNRACVWHAVVGTAQGDAFYAFGARQSAAGRARRVNSARINRDWAHAHELTGVPHGKPARRRVGDLGDGIRSKWDGGPQRRRRALTTVDHTGGRSPASGVPGRSRLTPSDVGPPLADVGIASQWVWRAGRPLSSSCPLIFLRTANSLNIIVSGLRCSGSGPGAR